MKPGFSNSESTFARMTGLVAGKVVDVHTEHNSVDVRCLSDGRRFVSVPVLGIGNTGGTGLIDLPVPDLSTGRDEEAKWNSGNTDERDIIAIIAFVEGGPVCLGFIYPPITEMTFAGPEARERRLHRHASDFYTSVDQDANVEIAHPNGTWIGMSEPGTKRRLTQRDYDRKWQVKRNIGRAVTGVISWWSGRKERARATVTPTGAFTAWLNELFNVRVGTDSTTAANLMVDQGGDIEVTSVSKITMHAGVPVRDDPRYIRTPSFTPSDTPGGESAEYLGNGGPIIKASRQLNAELKLEGPGILSMWVKNDPQSSVAVAQVQMKGAGEITIATNGDGLIKINAATEIKITAPSIILEAKEQVSIKAPEIKIKGETSIEGDLTVSGNVSAGGSIIDAGGNTPNHFH